MKAIDSNQLDLFTIYFWYTECLARLFDGLLFELYFEGILVSSHQY